jgi:hypothetical protein
MFLQKIQNRLLKTEKKDFNYRKSPLAQAAFLEVPDGVGGVRVRHRVEATEVELPGDDVAEVVVDGEANMDGLESVDVGLDHAVSLISRLRGVLLTAVVYDAGVMDVHRGVAGVMNKGVEEAQFELKIVFPYAADGSSGMEAPP